MSIKGITVNVDRGLSPKVRYVSENSPARGGFNNNSFSVRMNKEETKIASFNYDSTTSVKFNNQKDYRVKSFKYEISGAQFLRDLLDVYLPPAVENGSFLIYDLDLDKFITRTLTPGDINLGNIDAGIF